MCALGCEGGGFGWIAGVDGKGVAGGEDVAGHGRAHDADADPADSGAGWRDWRGERSLHEI